MFYSALYKIITFLLSEKRQFRTNCLRKKKKTLDCIRRATQDPKQIFGLKRNENGKWKMLHNEELPTIYCSPNIVTMIRSKRLGLAKHVARMEVDRSAFKILTNKPT